LRAKDAALFLSIWNQVQGRATGDAAVAHTRAGKNNERHGVVDLARAKSRGGSSYKRHIFPWIEVLQIAAVEEE
jgi:hypothetical protein